MSYGRRVGKTAQSGGELLRERVFVSEPWEGERIEDLGLIRGWLGDVVQRRVFVDVLAEVAAAELLQGRDGGHRDARSSHALLDGAFRERCEHAEGDVGSDLQVCQVVEGAQLKRALDGLEVLFDGVLAEVRPEQLSGGRGDVGLGHDEAQSIGAPTLSVSLGV